MASEFARAADEALGLDGLSDGVLVSPIFGKQYSPTFAELLLVGYVGLKKQIPERIVEAVCKNDEVGKQAEKIRETTMRWNSDPEAREINGSVTVMDLGISIAQIGTEAGPSSDLKANFLSIGVLAYKSQIAQVVNPIKGF
jgi:hypothetical protein